MLLKVWPPHWLEIQIPVLHPRPIEAQSLCVGPGIVDFQGVLVMGTRV